MQAMPLVSRPSTDDGPTLDVSLSAFVFVRVEY